MISVSIQLTGKSTMQIAIPARSGLSDQRNQKEMGFSFASHMVEH
jgi:hypothetical protein